MGTTTTPARPESERGDRGTCAFCGYGDGYLGEQGDDTTQQLHAAVRSGDSPDFTYAPHPKAWDENRQYVTWCGHCVGGLAHKFQRYDWTNLHALLISSQVRLELDGIRWSHWAEPKLRNGAHKQDDPAIHLDKLSIKRNIDDLENESLRRIGIDLTAQGWRE